MTLEDLIYKVEEEYCFGSTEWWVEKVKGFPKNEWFQPNNKGKDNDFTTMNEMHHHGWAAKKAEPIWHNGCYQGNTISFFIKIDQ